MADVATRQGMPRAVRNRRTLGEKRGTESPSQAPGGTHSADTSIPGLRPQKHERISVLFSGTGVWQLVTGNRSPRLRNSEGPLHSTLRARRRRRLSSASRSSVSRRVLHLTSRHPGLLLSLPISALNSVWAETQDLTHRRIPSSRNRQ